MKIQELLNKGYQELKSNNIENYIMDSQLLLAKVLKSDRMSIIINKDKEVSLKATEEFLQLINERKNRKPLKYITKTTQFMGIDLFIDEGVLIPRPDTEILVEEVLKEIKLRNYKSICDVCCGSGAIGISIAKYSTSSQVECCDISFKAEEVTRRNIELIALSNRVEFVKSNLMDYAIDAKKQYEVIVSNPPYIRTDVIPTLMEDVKDYEPYIALWGGEDGLDFYRKITEQSKFVLKKGGLLAYEIGYDQGLEVSDILTKSGYNHVRVIKDLAGLDRVVLGIKN